MAIQNASDLLVYAKTTDPVAQVTRIYVKTTNPLEMPEGATQGNVKINNITNGSGEVKDDVTTNNANNTAENLLSKIAGVLVTDNDYIQTTSVVSGDYTYRDFTNGKGTTPNEPKPGIVPTLEIVSGTATLNDDAIIIEVLTPGSSAIFDPVAFSTSASFSTNMDLRDVTNKDSGGWSESLGGLKSFEVSTDLLQSINPDVPLDGTDFFDKLKQRSLVDLSFSDRIRNIIRTNLTQIGVDGFGSSSGTQTNLQPDPFGGSTASKFKTAASTSYKFLKYTLDSARLEGKNVNWSFYIKGSGSTTSASITVSNIPTAQSAIITKLEGSGSIAQAGVGSQYWNITGLSTSSWTRVSFQMNNFTTAGGTESNPQIFRLVIYPGVYNSQDSSEILTSSWQIEFSPEATDYQDPTDITHWQGNALVSSVSFDAGVEDNLTCSATFTGTGNIYPNGLGPELIGDTGFDDSNYWGVFGDSVIENGYGKVKIGSSGTAGINKTNIVVAGNYYLLTYTIPSASPGTGSIQLEDADTVNINLPKSVGTHKIQYKAGDSELLIKRGENPTDIWLSSISLKKVL